MKGTYKVFDIFRKRKTQSCQHTFEGILMVVDPILHSTKGREQRVASTHTLQRGPVCLANASIQGLVLVRATMQVARDA